jgi:hypothetical protein
MQPAIGKIAKMANVAVFSRMDEELKRALEIQAKRERRSLSNLLVGAAEFYLRQHGAVAMPDALAVVIPPAPAIAALVPPATPGAGSTTTAPTARKPARKGPRSSARSTKR